jgi:hypothetical protein
MIKGWNKHDLSWKAPLPRHITLAYNVKTFSRCVSSLDAYRRFSIVLGIYRVDEPNNVSVLINLPTWSPPNRSNSHSPFVVPCCLPSTHRTWFAPSTASWFFFRFHCHRHRPLSKINTCFLSFLCFWYIFHKYYSRCSNPDFDRFHRMTI